MSEKKPHDDRQADANMRVGDQALPELRWLPVPGAPFRVTGLPWLAQDGVFRRLPLRPSHPIRPEVDRLANFTTGVQVRFRTDSPRLYIQKKYKITPKEYALRRKANPIN